MQKHNSFTNAEDAFQDFKQFSSSKCRKAFPLSLCNTYDVASPSFMPTLTLGFSLTRLSTVLYSYWVWNRNNAWNVDLQCLFQANSETGYGTAEIDGCWICWQVQCLAEPRGDGACWRMLVCHNGWEEWVSCVHSKFVKRFYISLGVDSGNASFCIAESSTWPQSYIHDKTRQSVQSPSSSCERGVISGLSLSWTDSVWVVLPGPSVWAGSEPATCGPTEEERMLPSATLYLVTCDSGLPTL